MKLLIKYGRGRMQDKDEQARAMTAFTATLLSNSFHHVYVQR